MMKQNLKFRAKAGILGKLPAKSFRYQRRAFARDVELCLSVQVEKDPIYIYVYFGLNYLR